MKFPMYGSHKIHSKPPTSSEYPLGNMAIEHRFPLCKFNIAMENHHFEWENELFRLGHFQ